MLTIYVALKNFYVCRYLYIILSVSIIIYAKVTELHGNMLFLLSFSRAVVFLTKYYSTLKMEAGIVFETLARVYQNRLDASQHTAY
jgi:hypothetical protein